MSVALIGDVTTTTALALASGWQTDPPPIIVEQDPSGGSLAGWLGLALAPSLSSLVTRSAQQPGVPPHEVVRRALQRARAGIDVIPAPIRSIEAARAVAEAEAALLAAVPRLGRPIVFDHGRLDGRSPVPGSAASSDIVAVVHRQSNASSAASAVRVERTSELLERVESKADGSIAVVVVGEEPFDPGELIEFFERSVDRPLIACHLPEDPLAAATLAGHTGVSGRRLARLPLMRAAVALASRLGASDQVRADDEVRARRAHREPHHETGVT